MRLFLTPRAFIRLIVLVIVTLWVLPTAAQSPTATPDPFADATHGSVTGRVTNGTAASSVPAGQPVSLLISTSDSILHQIDTVVNPDGTFAFTDVPIIAGAHYTAISVYRNRVFSSPFATGDPAVPAIDLSITIYELTEDPSVITISGTVAQITATGKTMEVRQVIRFNNHSDRVFTSSNDLGGGRYGSLLISLPPGAQAVSFDDPNRYVTSQADFAVLDTAPVYPGGDHLVVVVYILPYDGSTAIIEQPINYLFQGEARMLSWPETLSIKSDQLPDLGHETLGDREYRAFGGALTLEPGQVIHYELSGAPAPADTPAATTSGRKIGAQDILLVVGVLLLVAAGFIGLRLILRRRQPTTVSTNQNIDDLLKKIAELDQQHAAGKLAHDAWHRLRAPLKAQLDKLMDEE